MRLPVRLLYLVSWAVFVPGQNASAADLCARLDQAVVAYPPNRQFMGSVTKQFTATAILQLAEKGKLSVDYSACKYVDFCPDTWKKITIHQLLSHTSGIPSYTDDPGFSKPKFLLAPLTPNEIVLLSKNKPLEFKPVGAYQLGPLLTTITQENGHLMVQVKGQPKAEAFACSDTRFFLKVEDASLTFTPDGTSKAKELRLEQGGQSPRVN